MQALGPVVNRRKKNGGGYGTRVRGTQAHATPPPETHAAGASSLAGVAAGASAAAICLAASLMDSEAGSSLAMPMRAFSCWRRNASCGTLAMSAGFRPRASTMTARRSSMVTFSRLTVIFSIAVLLVVDGWGFSGRRSGGDPGPVPPCWRRSPGSGSCGRSRSRSGPSWSVRHGPPWQPSCRRRTRC